MRLSSIALHRSILLSFELPSLKDLATEQEHMLADWIGKNFGELEERVKEHPPEDELDHEHLEVLVDEIRFREDKYPQLLRSSNFLISYGAVESGLHRLAKATFRDGKSTVEPPSQNFYLQDAKTFFEAAGVNFSTFSTDWELLDSFRLVRNVVAHASGNVNPDDRGYDNLAAFIDTRPDVSISDTQRIVLKESWCTSFVEVGITSVRGICDQLIPRRVV